MNDEPDAMRDTSDLYQEVNDDLDNAIEVEYDGPDLENSYEAEDHIMSPMMDVLQTLGVSAADSANYCVQAIKDRPRRTVQYGEPYKPTFFEVYGQGNIVQASHGCRRNLNVNGLRAFDLRTCKPDRQAWDFTKASDRREARRYVEEDKPQWLIGCPHAPSSRYGIKA